MKDEQLVVRKVKVGAVVYKITGVSRPDKMQEPPKNIRVVDKTKEGDGHGR